MKKKAEQFEFTSYKLEMKNQKAVFKYRITFENSEPLDFIDVLNFPNLISCPKNQILDKILQNLHIILGISYYKLYAPKKIKLNKPLSKEQANFFNIVYRKGLGEFCYVNNIESKRIAKFPYEKKFNADEKNKNFYPRNNRILVGIAGGKDSIVASELLKAQGEDITGFIVDTQGTMQAPENTANLLGIKTIKIKHILDKKIYNLSLRQNGGQAPHSRSAVAPSNTAGEQGRLSKESENMDGSFSGHVPFSAIVAFIGFLIAFLYDFSYVSVANEYSSNFGNIKYKGEEINHQWSKTSEFENLFQKYTKKFITPSITYFSALRPFYEIRIVKMFSKYKKYFPYFTSCNENFKKCSPLSQGEKKLWCGKCPKCVFMFTFLAAFLNKKELCKIFKKNLFDDEKNFPLFKDLLGFGKLKPFDCVGTFEEMRVAFYMASKKYKNNAVVKKFLPEIQNNISKNLIKKVFATNPASCLPIRFKFLGLENALILGYGKEGKSTHSYLKNIFPKLKISISDKKFRKNPAQDNFDLIIKTPGISKISVMRPYTTAANIFFSEIKKLNADGKKIITIGVTGSKGKSTTASLIYSILKEAGKNVQLVGNIGKPMLNSLLQPIASNEIFVIELSSYQLDDIEFSPDIAVVLNLFPEHMNYHGNVEEYYKAKQNIINFQNEQDFFIFNPQNKKLRLWAKNSKAKSIPFIAQTKINDDEVNLIGEHNKKNIKAAITAAKLFKISDKYIQRAVKKFNPLPHRLEFLGQFNGIKFYDDAISTTPESAIMAIKTLKNIGTIFLGGEDRGYDFTKLEKILKKYKIKNIALFPDSGKRIIKDRTAFNILETKSTKEAVKFAFKYTPKKSICLLSPASPSYSLWKNFEERGGEFKKEIKKS